MRLWVKKLGPELRLAARLLLCYLYSMFTTMHPNFPPVLQDATSGHFLGWQLAGLITIVAWSASMAYFMFKTLGKLGRLRISALTEQLGVQGRVGTVERDGLG